MSYQVIARKWRPKSFADLIGQGHVSQTLQNALKNERLPHALLFTGPRGTGKTSSARILAMSLRCPNAENFVPCGECEDCKDISSGRSIDVVEIDGASNNGVDAIRELRDTVGYMPSSGKYKVYIIDEVHMLSTSAFNALLKTLEEPPEHVIFIMATTEVHKIPNTILSRCQRFDFRRIPTRMISDRLQSICESENVKADEEALWMVARQADGSMRDSQSLLDQVITYSEKHITLAKVVDVLGLTDRQLLLNTLAGLVERDVQKIIAVIANIFASGVDPKVFMQELLEEVRHLLMVKLCPNDSEKLVDLSQTEIEDLKQKAASLSQEDIHLLFDMALKGANDIPRAQDPKVVLEMLLLRMAEAPRISSLAGVTVTAGQATASKPAPTSSPRVATPAPQPKTSAAPPQAIPRQAAPTPTAKPAAPKPAPTPAPPVKKQEPQEETVAAAPTGDSSQQWTQLVSRIKKVNGLVAAKLEHSYLVNLQDKNVTIGVPPKMKFLFDQINESSFQNKLTNYMNTFWGPGYTIDVQLGDEKKSKQLSPKAIEENTRQQKANDVEKKLKITLSSNQQTNFSKLKYNP